MDNRFIPRKRPGQFDSQYRINYGIRVPNVRLVGDNVEIGIYPIQQAMQMAQEKRLDLVEIAANADPPVCKIVDFSKFKYEQKKKLKEIKAKSKLSPLKEIRFSPDTDEHDFQFKLKHAMNFLKDGSKIRAFVHFKGRAIVYKERGEVVLLKLAQGLEEYAKVEEMPRLEGKRMVLTLSPKPKNG